MVINGAIVSDLDMMYLESVLQEELSLCMMMRSSRTEPPDIGGTICVFTDVKTRNAFVFLKNKLLVVKLKKGMNDEHTSVQQPQKILL